MPYNTGLTLLRFSQSSIPSGRWQIELPSPGIEVVLCHRGRWNGRNIVAGSLDRGDESFNFFRRGQPPTGQITRFESCASDSFPDIAFDTGTRDRNGKPFYGIGNGDQMLREELREGGAITNLSAKTTVFLLSKMTTSGCGIEKNLGLDFSARPCRMRQMVVPSTEKRICGKGRILKYY